MEFCPPTTLHIVGCANHLQRQRVELCIDNFENTYCVRVRFAINHSVHRFCYRFNLYTVVILSTTLRNRNDWNRTSDTRLTRSPLYQLSYIPILDTVQSIQHILKEVIKMTQKRQIENAKRN